METKTSTSYHNFKSKKTLVKSKIKSKENNKISPSKETLLKKELQTLKEKKERLQKKSVDEKKLAHLQKLIDRGKYRVAPDELADKIIEKYTVDTNETLKK